MAGREKKPALTKKQTPSPVPPKEGAASTENATTNAKEMSSIVAANRRKVLAQRTLKKKLKVPFKHTKKKPALKISKSIYNVAQSSLDPKKAALIKNGISAPKRIRKPTSKALTVPPPKVQIKVEPNDEPPVLEPMEPIPNENGVVSDKKEIKKRTVKKTVSGSLDVQDENKPAPDVEGSSESPSSTEKGSETPTKKNVKKQKTTLKKPVKEETETLDDVMNQLSEQMNMDQDILKSKKSVIRKAKVDSPKRKIVKKDTLMSLNKDLANDPSVKNVIDMLDLNVAKRPLKQLGKKRRHSIEKFPASPTESSDNSTFSLFPNTPRSVSPRTRRGSKIRQSIDASLSTRRSSPYTTRSDSPARILRNGKQRKLKDILLMDGIESVQKRRRLCSELSGSELSKNSGFESDTSSYSDLAPPLDNSGDVTDTKEEEKSTTKPDVKSEKPEPIAKIPYQIPDEVRTLDIKSISTKFTQILKRSLSTDINLDKPVLLPNTANGTVEKETEKPIPNVETNKTDTNSNLCSEVKPDIAKIPVDIPIKKEDTEDSSDNQSLNSKLCPESKVPEKKIILDIMKQTFNEVEEQDKDKDKRPTRSSARIKKTSEKSVEDKPVNPPTNKSPTETPSKIEEPINTTNKPEEKEVIENETKEAVVDSTEEKELQTIPASITDGASDETSDNPKPELEPEQPDQTSVDEEPEEPVTEEMKLILEESDKKSEVSDKEGHIDIEEIEESKSELQSEMLIKALIENTAETLEKDNLLRTIETEPEEREPEVRQPSVNGDKTDEEEKMELDLVNENTANIEETPENLAKKENILQALGLQSLKAAAEAKLREKVVPKQDSYTGTLKTVIKINRGMDKKRRKNSLKMTIQKKGKKDGSGDMGKGEDSKESGSTPWRHGTHSSDTAGAHRKTHYSNRSNLDGSSEHTSDGDTAAGEEGTAKALVIPEKASSFSVHPGRLCKDECCYCFGKFGLFDTPCHIAQMKSVERQEKILSTEVHLTRDSCLCDACYRHVDRKSNTPFYKGQLKKANLVAPGPRINHCHVLGCDQVSTNILKRKWLIKMRKSVSKVINIDLDNPGLHSIPVCEKHYASLEHLMVCAMCKRKLARNHIHYLGPECASLNKALDAEGIPVTLVDKPVVCKLCRLFSTILLKPEENNENKIHFFNEYKKRLLHFHNIELMDEAEADEPISFPSKDRTESKEKDKEVISKKRKSGKVSKPQATSPPVLEPQVDINKPDQDRVPSEENNDKSGSESPTDYMVDYGALTPNITMECGGSDVELTKREVPKKQFLKKSIPPMTNASQLKNDKPVKEKQSAMERLGSNSSISVRQLFPGEEDLPLQGSIDFSTIKERTPEGWEKCSSIIQYDLNTKHLWQELQKPYGNQSSFLRHLILLEKYFRNGDLVLSHNASHHAINYSESVQNRLRAYDNISTTSPLQQISMLPLNQSQSSITKSSGGGIVLTNETSPKFTMINAANIPKNTPITISQLSSLTPITIKAKTSSAPPGLISIQPGANKSTPPLGLKMSQKIKFPIGKNWQPTLRPVDQSAKTSEKKRISGLVQVIKDGKPYHISLEDYNRWRSLQRSQEKNQKPSESSPSSATSTSSSLAQNNSLLKTNLLGKKKLTVTSKTLANLSKKPLDEMTSTDNKNDQKSEFKGGDKPPMLLPKIPKSLTVIPQTITKKTRPLSPILSITPKPKTTAAATGKS